MAGSEPFTFITESEEGRPKQLFSEYHDLTSAKVADLDVQLVASLRKQYPELIMTTIPASNVNLLAFAAAGHAVATLDTETEAVIRWRGFLPPASRGDPGAVGGATFFAKYRYQWAGEDFVLHTVKVGFSTLQYVCKEPQGRETTRSVSRVTDALIAAVGGAQLPTGKEIYVFDGYWYRSQALWEQVEKTRWEDVILDEDMKKELTDVTGKFFDSKETYEEYGVPWKRGLIFHGPVGNGKTLSIKALMHTLRDRDDPIPCLYVKAAPATYYIGSVFAFARTMSPCLLILEDIESIVNSSTRSYFFNEVDGLENNDGIMMLATTNYLDRLDPGLAKRPSRFDRKYKFPLPSLSERTKYCEFWKNKLSKKDTIEFPKKLCPAIARITNDFSFAYLQEAFVSTLLELARQSLHGHSDSEGDDEDDGLGKYPLWRVMKEQVKILRQDMGSSKSLRSPRISGFNDGAPWKAEAGKAFDSVCNLRPGSRQAPSHLPKLEGTSLAFSPRQAVRPPPELESGCGVFGGESVLVETSAPTLDQPIRPSYKLDVFNSASFAYEPADE